MNRLRFYDFRNSRAAATLGLCQADIFQLAQYVNSAQRNLIEAPEAGDEGWWGTWAEIAFNVSRTSPYYTAPREVARLETAAVCQCSIPIYNQFYEYLDFGNGRMPKQFLSCRPHQLGVYSRNVVPTWIDLPEGSNIIQVVIVDETDQGKRILFTGNNSQNEPIYTRDGLNPVNGQFVMFASPFANADEQMTTITGIQKDVTAGQVQIFAVNPTTAEKTLLLIMQPDETSAAYRRYFFGNLPNNCCQENGIKNITVTGIAKLDLVPVRTDTDYLLIQSLEALIDECQAIRYGDMDTPAAKQMAQAHHNRAVQKLNGQLIHYMGKDPAAVNFKPFGSARLEHRKIGTLI